MKTTLATFAMLSLAAGMASAHASFEQSDVVQSATAKLVLRVPHGCDGEATLKLRVQIPEGVHSVKPMPKAGWTLETVTGAYEGTYDNHGKPVTEGVKEIIWTGELPDAFYDEFTFRGTIADVFATGSTVWFPATQECANGSKAWVNLPAEGQDPHDVDMPAPGVKVIGAGHTH